MVRAAREKLALPIWGELRKEGKSKGLPTDSQNFQGINVELEDHNVLSKSKEAEITRGVVLGWNSLSYAYKPKVEDSFILGHNALSGSGEFRDFTPEKVAAFEPIARRYLSEDMKSIEKLGRFEQRISQLPPEEKERLSQDRKQRIEELVAYNKCISPEEKEHVRKLFEETRPDIYKDFAGYDNMQITENAPIENLAVAAHEIEGIMHKLSFSGECYGVQIDNSVVYGWNALGDAIGGEIKDSIIGGVNPLSGANIHIVNSYIVSPKGIEYVKDEYRGNPALVPDLEFVFQ